MDVRRDHSGDRPKVLAVVDVDESRAGYMVLERVAELAREVDLHVVGRVDRWSHRSAAKQRRQLRDLLHEASGLFSDDASSSGELRQGDLRATVLGVGTEMRPTLVVIGVMQAIGMDLVAIAGTLSVPVLLVREPTTHGGVVAASDAMSETMSALAAARRTPCQHGEPSCN